MLPRTIGRDGTEHLRGRARLALARHRGGWRLGAAGEAEPMHLADHGVAGDAAEFARRSGWPTGRPPTASSEARPDRRSKSAVRDCISVRFWSKNVIGLCSTSNLRPTPRAESRSLVRRPLGRRTHARSNVQELRGQSAARDVVPDLSQNYNMRVTRAQELGFHGCAWRPPFSPANGHSRNASAASVWQARLMLTGTTTNNRV